MENNNVSKKNLELKKSPRYQKFLDWADLLSLEELKKLFPEMQELHPKIFRII